MNGTALAQDLRAAFDADIGARSPAERYRDPAATPWERDAMLVQVVYAYRADARWSTLLLELLAPAMSRRLGHLGAKPPVIDDDDLRNQLVLEVLKAASAMPMPAMGRHVEQRIIRRACWMLHRRLEREAHYQELIEPLPNEDEEDDEEEEE